MPEKKRKLKPWTTLSSEIVHQNKYYAIRHDEFVLPNGKTGNYYIYDREASVFIIPIKKGKIIFGKQFRYPIKKWSIEVPGGAVKDGYTFLQAAKEELREEAGYLGKLKRIGKFIPYNGISRETCMVFLATDLEFIGTNLEDSEVIQNLEIEISKAYEMIEKGKITDGMTISALAIARKYLLR